MPLKDKDARNKYIRSWQKANPEKFKEYMRKSREKRKEKDKELRKAWEKKYDAEHPGERVLKRRLRRQAKLPVFHEHCSKYWRAEHQEELKEFQENYNKNYYKKNREVSLLKSHEYLLNLRLEVLYWYSNGLMKCILCGENHLEFLAIDHINGGGNKDRQKIKGNFTYYLIKEKFPEGYQVLCHNCNTAKHMSSIVRKDPTASYNKYKDRVRIEMLQKYSQSKNPKCACCGCNNMQVLTFNHVNGGGTQQRRAMKSKSFEVYLYKNDVPLTEINVLCQNCNKALGHYGECPHNKN